ncbi:tRNA (5-methylaminomethyl-2-thiouridylate)-methyltransferase [Coprinopsis cinerea okayama7|uniref:tRNA-5-taurinomethyluridine 2-sulfurtransferase n=1 Tax=Coprinopsis cinerea (strain Okayama-7 / 130 / ATCC MYA-4618 / FGSC 9003) TaxID=240176 RepID=A8NDW7_COPC7|nr:tRNA (5-methylaminomethyl-2-thiouridylate)-methyltransferase [Coprinopsis cinerea okayama7\|eukprot:XP_001832878.2 tRNA (5-methylaminomethyl-2-thiouridylate)-methyltransferase [Coprinopsis cinerea okayama7\
MSGGVDSSVAALLLAQQDYDLSAVFMRNWDTRDESGSDRGCEWEKDWEDVQRVCKKLDIPCSMIDLSREYWNRVFEPSLQQWELGTTPNADVWCNRKAEDNREIKFGALLERLPPDSSGQRPWFATGHYARKTWSEGPNARPKLVRPADGHKDQTYYLSSISESGLQRALFPINHLQKPQVRELAQKHDLHNAQRPDSVGICFVGEKAKFHNFLSCPANYIPAQKGLIIDETTGKVLGKHQGLWNYTIGEGSRLPGMPTRMAVSRKDPSTNTIYHESLYTNVINVPEFTWIWSDSVPTELDTPEGFRASVMHRYRMKAVPCTVRRSSGQGVTVQCDDLEQAVTPGQVAVLYSDDWCLGCGVIASSELVQ